MISTRTALAILAALSVVFLLQFAQSMVVPVVLGILINYALDPLVGAVASRGVPRAAGAALVLLAVVAAGCAVGYGLSGQANAIVQRLPQQAQHVRELLTKQSPAPATAIRQVQKAANELERAATAAAPAPPAAGVTRVQVEPAPLEISKYVVWGSISVATAVAQFVLILFFVYFLLASGDLFRRKTVRLAGPTLAEKRVTAGILEEIDRQISLLLLAQVSAGIAVAIAAWLAFRALGLENAAVWGLLAGVFNTIPYFGPLIVAGGAAAVAFLQFGTVERTLAVAGAALLVSAAEGFVLTPWLTRHAARMNAVAVFVGLLFWGWLWNVWGLLLAVPMMMALKVVCDRVDDLKPIGELLGD